MVKIICAICVFTIGIFMSNAGVAQASKIELAETEGPLNHSMGRKNLISFNDQLFYGSLIYEEGNKFRRNGLWKFDAELGAVLVKETGEGGIGPFGFIIFDEQLYFVARDDNSNTVIWKSDGTTEGTQKVQDAQNGGAVRVGGGGANFFVWKEELYFRSDAIRGHGQELYKTNGTPEGTTIVKNLDGGSSTSQPTLMTDFGDNFLFFNVISFSMELWKSDGTVNGTEVLKNFGTVSKFHSPVYFNSELYFYVQTEGTGGIQLWKSDGTANGTIQLTLKDGLSFEFDKPVLTLYEGKLYFFAKLGEKGVDLWNTDGTVEGTSQIKQLDPDYAWTLIFPMIIHENNLLVQTPNTIWSSDGTEAGTHILYDDSNGGLRNLSSIDGILYFFQYEDEGKVLKRYDGQCAIDVVSLTTDRATDDEVIIATSDFIFFPFPIPNVNSSDLWKVDLSFQWPDQPAWFLDSDGDGFGDANVTILACTKPVGYVSDNTDCDDSSASINAGASWYLDADGDSFGDTNSSLVQCTQPDGYVSDNTDCDDSSLSINPETAWYLDFDGDGFGDANITILACTKPVGYVSDNTDCDDSSEIINAGVTWYLDADGDSFGDASSSLVQCVQPVGYVSDNTDCDDTSLSITVGTIWYLDSDGDSFGDPNSSILQCEEPVGYVSNNTDCDDSLAEINAETVWYLDSDGDGLGIPETTLTQCEQPDNYVLNNTDCDDTDMDINEDCVTGIDDGLNNAIDLVAFPNPSKDMVTITFQNRSNLPFDFRLIDGMGRILNSKSYGSGDSFHFSTRNASPGLYFVQVLIGGTKYVQRLIVN